MAVRIFIRLYATLDTSDFCLHEWSKKGKTSAQLINRLYFFNTAVEEK
jgi:hypothetical protein